MLRNLFRASAVGAAALVAIGLSMPSAQAATGYARCPAGYFCLFADPNGYGTMAYFRFGSPDLRGQHIDNAASSAWDRSNEAFSFCDGYNYTDYFWTFFPNAQGNLEPANDNRASSIQMYAFNCSG
jgi:Peptidase inhibitor family I36